MRIGGRSCARSMGLATLACAAGVCGCLLLHPDSDPHLVMLRVVASPGELVSSGPPVANGTSPDEPLSVPCPVPETLLCADNLTAVVRVWRDRWTPEGRLVETQLLTEGPLEVGPPAPASCTRVLTGSIAFEAGGASDTYRLEVDLLYRGDDPRGVWSGEVALDSGLSCRVSPLVIGERRARITAACFGLTGEHEFDHTYEGHEFLASYADSVDWPGYRRKREARITMTGRLQPAAIFTGSVALGTVRPGSDQEVSLDLAPATQNLPGDVGERFVATIQIAFTDGNPPQESGSLRVTRQDPCAPR